MQPFLKTIARAYAERYADLSHFCFVFPGRRSGTFFIKHLNDFSRQEMVAPQTVTISDFAYSVSGLLEDSRIDLLFLLYDCYVKVWRELHGAGAEVMTIDRFRSFGEMIISDFNDIDMHLADADAIYQNLSDLDNIATDYLTDEQKEVMTKYFGIDVSKPQSEHFWKKFDYHSSRDDDRRETEIRDKFLTFREALAAIYHRFREALRREGLSYSGMAYRTAFERLTDAENPVLLEPAKIVFVGFNVLTSAEWHIFRELKGRKTVIEGREEPYADFIWDYVGNAMADSFNSAARFVKAGMRAFPKPEWLHLTDADTEGIPAEIRVIAAPSNAVQTKIVSGELSRLLTPNEDTGKVGELEPDEFAVVLPDEGLLLPLLHSLPQELSSVNLTMGLGLRYTPTVAFMMLMRRLRTNATMVRGVFSYMHKDVSALLSHPFSRVLLGEATVKPLQAMLKRSRRIFIPFPALLEQGNPSGTELLFRQLRPDEDVERTVVYLEEVLSGLRRRLISAQAAEQRDEDTGYIIGDTLTIANIDCYREALQRLADTCRRRGAHPNMVSTFMLADLLIAGEKIFFEGEPLEGIQIMGLLETRSLDFRHLIIPSMNERIFPKRMFKRTMIPNTLRVAYGLPTKSSQESIFAYYFYRMISRAESVSMIYDARTGGTRSGEPSRYITQLERLYARGRVKRISYRFDIQEPPTPPISAKKTEEVMAVLRRFTDEVPEPERIHLSASSLNTYLSCPLRFYFKYICGLEVESEPEEFMSSLEIGDIVHKVMEELYLGEGNSGYMLDTPRKISKTYFEQILKKDDPTISNLLRKAINQRYVRAENPNAPLSGEAQIMHEMLRQLIYNMVKADSALYNPEIIGAEVRMKYSYPFNEDSRRANLVAVADRMDSIIDENGERRIRIVDYKTGKININLKTNLSAIFLGEKPGKYVFQLLFYCMMARTLPRFKDVDAIQPLIYGVFKGLPMSPAYRGGDIASDRQILDNADKSQTELSEFFRKGLDEVLTELFSEGEFTQTPEPENCKYCNFRLLCKR